MARDGSRAKPKSGAAVGSSDLLGGIMSVCLSVILIFLSVDLYPKTATDPLILVIVTKTVVQNRRNFAHGFRISNQHWVLHRRWKLVSVITAKKFKNNSEMLHVILGLQFLSPETHI